MTRRVGLQGAQAMLKEPLIAQEEEEGGTTTTKTYK
jgi:hypothetical protein